MDPQLHKVIEQIRLYLPGTGSVALAANKLREFLLSFGEVAPEMEQRIVRAAELLEREFGSVEILRQNSVIRNRESWYVGPDVGSRHWPALRDYLVQVKNWSKDSIEEIDKASTEVVSLLDDPRRETFACRGLVVGHVQSGKTANMTAVLAKAVDAGYDTIIVLAGLTNKLRQQTQRRFEEDIVERLPLLWQKLTTAEEDGDFKTPPQGGFLHHIDKAQLVVVKKWVSRLDDLIETVKGTQPAALKRLRVLVIDDECDQASVNSASGETDITRINLRIRELLKALPCVAYVGYTATPFANVLINPRPTDGAGLDDLYPKDFITALRPSPGYFGTEKLFGKPAALADAALEDDDGLDMIRDVPSADEAMLQPQKAKDRETFYPRMPKTLEDAVLYYLACCAVRHARGDAGEHMTMLVHTSSFVVIHERVANLIEDWVELIKPSLRKHDSEISKRLTAVWKEEQDRLPQDITSARQIDLPEIFNNLPAVLNKLSVVVENGNSDDRINYTPRKARTPKTYIVVGGSILARGLTLEGLMVSYFLRNANQYDTLLQMGRWFGFRHGYEDLPRIWMPQQLQLNFRALAGVEAEIRADIRQYVDQDPLSPLEFAVRIRALPGMAITSANKMKHATRCDISYWGRHVQTIRFDHRNDDVVKSNWRAASEFVSLVKNVAKPSSDQKFFTNVPKTSVVRFLRAYSVQASHKDLSNKTLVSFIENAPAVLDHWNVAVMETNSGKASEKPLGNIGNVNLFNRSRFGETGNVADIKALMSRQDVLIDCTDRSNWTGLSWAELKERRAAEVGEVPLLLIYPIDANSAAKPDSKVRKSLDAIGDLIGLGVIFPGSSELSGQFYSVELDPPDPDELARIEEEERLASEAAGVE